MNMRASQTVLDNLENLRVLRSELDTLLIKIENIKMGVVEMLTVGSGEKNGFSTGDRIKDFVIVRHDFDPTGRYENVYRALEGKAHECRGQLVLVLKQEEISFERQYAFSGAGMMPPLGPLTRFTPTDLGILSGDIVFDLGKGCRIFTPALLNIAFNIVQENQSIVWDATTDWLTGWQPPLKPIGCLKREIVVGDEQIKAWFQRNVVETGNAFEMRLARTVEQMADKLGRSLTIFDQ